MDYSRKTKVTGRHRRYSNSGSQASVDYVTTHLNQSDMVILAGLVVDFMILGV